MDRATNISRLCDLRFAWSIEDETMEKHNTMHKITPSPAFRILELGDKSNKYEIPAGNTEALIKVLGFSPTLVKSNDGNRVKTMLKKKAINTNSGKKNCLDHRSLLFVERIRLDDKI